MTAGKMTPTVDEHMLPACHSKTKAVAGEVVCTKRSQTQLKAKPIEECCDNHNCGFRTPHRVAKKIYSREEAE